MVDEYEVAQACRRDGESVQALYFVLFGDARMHLLQRNGEASEKAEFAVRQREVVDGPEAVLLTDIGGLDARLLADFATNGGEWVWLRCNLA